MRIHWKISRLLFVLGIWALAMTGGCQSADLEKLESGLKGSGLSGTYNAEKEEIVVDITCANLGDAPILVWIAKDHLVYTITGSNYELPNPEPDWAEGRDRIIRQETSSTRLYPVLYWRVEPSTPGTRGHPCPGHDGTFYHHRRKIYVSPEDLLALGESNEVTVEVQMDATILVPTEDCQCDQGCWVTVTETVVATGSVVWREQ